MISTNLSTRPFYNERLVRLLLVVLGAIVVAITAANAWTFVTLSRRDAAQNTQTASAERKTEEARRAAQGIRQGINPAELNAVTAAASEANRLIGQRTFSWTRLLSEFEETLPADVRVTGVAPHVDREGRMFVAIYVVGRRAEDINEFAEKLEARGAFADVTWTDETVNPEGLRETTLNGRYVGTAQRSH
jgi:hypothetical protein